MRVSQSKSFCLSAPLKVLASHNRSVYRALLWEYLFFLGPFPQSTCVAQNRKCKLPCILWGLENAVMAQQVSRENPL